MQTYKVVLVATLICFALFVIALSYNFWKDGVLLLIAFWGMYFALFAFSHIHSPKVCPKVYRMTATGIYINGGFFSWNSFSGYRVGNGFVYPIGRSGKEVMALPRECERVIKDHLSRV